VTEWDARAFARGAALAALALVLAGVVTAASDEGGLAWGARAGRTLPLAPVCAAVGAWLALAPARARGDERALAALGRSPWEREVAAILGGAIVALAAALAIGCLARIDVSGFYPRPEQSLHWTFDGAAFTSDGGQWRVGADGAPSLARTPPTEAPGAAEGVPPRGRASAALSTAALGLALPMLVARARSRRAATLALGAIAAGALATLLAFQAAAAAVASPLLAPVPPLLLLAWAASRYRAGAWSRARYRR
jgi:hypothetical protein